MNRLNRSQPDDLESSRSFRPGEDNSEGWDEFLKDGYVNPHAPGPSGLSLFEDEGAVVIEHALPTGGLHELEKEIQRCQLEVRGLFRWDTRQDVNDYREASWAREEIRITVGLPETLEEGEIETNVDDGWLVIRIPCVGDVRRETVEVVTDLE